MAEKNLKARIVHKHDTEANWLLATNFTPMKGEIIVYDIDDNYSYERIKIGDGVQNVNDLPFADDALKNELETEIGEISALVGDTAVSTQISEAIANIPQSDWDQSDETAADYIKNRTHYKTPNNQTVLDGTFVVETFNGYPAVIFPDGFYLEPYVSYTVTVNGVSETKTSSRVKYATGEQYGIFPSDTSGVSDHWIQHATTGQYILYNDAVLVTGENCTITIIDNREYLYTKLDEQYLPEGLGGAGNGDYSWIFGNVSGNEADGENSLAHGQRVKATGDNSFAVGSETVASGGNSHAEGWKTTASGYGSHSEGAMTTASGDYSHTEGFYTKAETIYQHVEGTYNIEDSAANSYTKGTYAHIVGNGTSDSKRSNAYTLDWDGNANFTGDVYVGNANENKAGKKLSTEEYVDNQISTFVGDTSVSSQISTALSESAVLYSDAQALTDEQKQQAQDNIGFSENDALSLAMELDLVSPVAAEDGSIYTDENGVLYSL